VLGTRIPAREAGEGIKPGVKRSGTPGQQAKQNPAREAVDSGHESTNV
jgi:hypothetical protein